MDVPRELVPAEIRFRDQGGITNSAARRGSISGADVLPAITNGTRASSIRYRIGFVHNGEDKRGGGRARFCLCKDGRGGSQIQLLWP